MKKYGLYPGCLMPTEQYSYELSLRETLPLLDVELVDIPDFSCCGEPLKSVNKMMTIYLSARNLALAEKHHLDLLVPCPMCHLALSECKRILTRNEEIHEKITVTLESEHLKYTGKTNLFHTVDLLHDVVGVDEIKKHIKTPFKELKTAVHYGCHLLRPTDVGRPVNAENPQKIEAILKAIGLKPYDYAQKLDCCGAPLLVNHPETSLTKTGQKLQAVQTQGFELFVDVCPWCHKMFDSRQTKAGETVATKLQVPVVYLTQLLGVALGADIKKLGFNLNQSPIEKLLLE
ncbi:MAG: CoB--CoM heterodisulfide reductase iron-sulfur subunit B family protein [Euryarchaeota archaeon]|nr:CoB--CoM heterodisulfide reductase iron-sulfur subunit B family protein [Euryarchaeota archaeon]